MYVYNFEIVQVCVLFYHAFLNDNSLLDRDLSCNSEFIQFLLIYIIYI